MRAKLVGERFGALLVRVAGTRRATATATVMVGTGLLSVGLLVGWGWYLGFLGFLVGLLAATFVFGRRVQATAYSQVEGQIGAAAAVLQNMRGDWRVTPAVGFTREQDLVHRVVGRPGIVLVGEGSPSRVRSLMANEKKKLARFIGDTPVYDVTVGDGEGQVPLRELSKRMKKLDKKLTQQEVQTVHKRISTLGNRLPIPKGVDPMRARPDRRAMRGR